MVKTVLGRPIPDRGRAEYTARIESLQSSPTIILEHNDHTYRVLRVSEYEPGNFPDATPIAQYKEGRRIDGFTAARAPQYIRPDVPGAWRLGRKQPI